MHTLLLFVACTATSFAQIVVSEIYPIPLAGEQEWIELHNTSNVEVLVKDFSLHDASGSVDLPTFRIGANTFVVLSSTDDGFPEGVHVVATKIPTLNNTSDEVRLVDKTGAVVSAMEYTSSEVTEGKSLERIAQVEDDSITYGNLWDLSRSPSGNTAGSQNSNTRFSFDISAESIVIGSAIQLELKNVGKSVARNVSAEVALNGRPDTLHIQRIEVNESWFTSIEFSNIYVRSDSANDVCFTVLTTDANTNNNNVCSRFVTPPAAGTVVINEIMFNPVADRDDWVEVFNASTEDVDISGWTLGDEVATSTIPEQTMLTANSLIVLAMNSSVRFEMTSGEPIILKPAINFNSTGDAVILRNADGAIVDSVFYADDWHSPHLDEQKGVSLERRSARLASQSKSTWTSSGDASGGTPGRENSAATTIAPTFQLTASPSPFSTNEGSHLHPAVVSVTLPFEQAVVGVFVFDRNGLWIADVLNSGYTGAEFSVAWDGRDASGRAVPIGQYVVVVTAVDANSSRTFRNSCVVVVGE